MRDVILLRQRRRAAHAPVSKAGLEAVEERVEGSIAGRAQRRDGGVDAVCRTAGPRVRHLHGIEGILDFGTVRPGDARGSHEVRAGKLKRVVVVQKIRRGNQVTGEGPVLDLRRLGEADSGDRDSVVGSPVHHQRVGVVRDAAVSMDPAEVLEEWIGLALELGVGHLPWVAECRGRHHVPNGAKTGEILAHVPADRAVIVAGSVEQVDGFPEDVGERLVQGARLHVIEEVRAALDHSVGEFVGHHVIGARKAVAVDHLLTVPECVRVGAGAFAGGGAMVHGRHQGRTRAVVAVASVVAEEVVVCVAGKVVRAVGINIARGRAAFGSHQGAGQGAGAVPVVDKAIAGVRKLAESKQRHSIRGIDPDELAQVLAACLDEPGQPPRKGAAIQEPLVENLEAWLTQDGVRRLEVLGNQVSNRVEGLVRGHRGNHQKIIEAGCGLAIGGEHPVPFHVQDQLATGDGNA